MDLPNHGTVHGYWDLRGKEREYLGVADGELSGKRVLEIGPASGCLTFWMEKQGADVVAVDVPSSFVPEYVWDVPRSEPVDLRNKISDAQGGLAALHNSWWLTHGENKSKARMYYGSAYDLPDELGGFDVVTLACVLLHNKSPHLILERAARFARDAMIVVEMVPAGDAALSDHMIFLRDDTSFYDGWFHFPPKLTVRMLKSMGFPNATTTFHQQMMEGKPYSLYTVVARR